MISERKPRFFFGLGGIILIVLGILAGVNVLQTLAATGIMLVGTALISTICVIIGTFSIFTGIILHVIVKQRGRTNGEG